MSVTLRSPVVARKTRSRASRMEEGGCWEESVCSGDVLIREHASRASWWLASALVVIALVFVGVIMQHAYLTANTGSWSTLHASTWIQPTPRALASLVGIALTLDLYSSYMQSLRKGHLDRYVGQFVLGSVIRVVLWLMFLYGLAFGGSIGSMMSLIALALVLSWSFLTSHGVSPLHSWMSAGLLVFVIFLIIFMGTSNAKIWPSA